MTTSAKIGMGTLFALARPAAPAAFVIIGERTKVPLPKLSRDAIDATHMDSADQYREFIAGLRQGGDLPLEMNLVPGSASEMLLLEHFADSVTWPCKMTLPNGATWEAAVLMTNYEPDPPMDGKMTASATFKISGKPVFTEAA